MSKEGEMSFAEGRDAVRHAIENARGEIRDTRVNEEVVRDKIHITASDFIAGIDNNANEIESRLLVEHEVRLSKVKFLKEKLEASVGSGDLEAMAQLIEAIAQLEAGT